jgi:hypothetical protein
MSTVWGMASDTGELRLGGNDGCIAGARHLAAAFLEQARTAHGLAVSAPAMDLTQLVVSGLVTNARKYAPGQALMNLRIADGIVDVVVWDSDPTVPTARTAYPGRVGQHGLEIVKAVACTSTWNGKRSASASPPGCAWPIHPRGRSPRSACP